MFSRLYFAKALLIGLSLFMSGAAHAELTQVSALIQASNECGGQGYFDQINGNGFSDCQIIVKDANGNNQYLYDVIVKYDGNLSHDETSSYYTGNVADSDFQFTDTTTGNANGTWTYNDGQFKYPDIRFWLAKSGAGPSNSGFNLFWMVDSTEIGQHCEVGPDSSNLSFACMSLAQSVTTGTWSTPLNTNLSNKNLSHLTFFGGLCKEGETRAGCGSTPVPEPSPFVLLTLALFALAACRKRAVIVKS